MLKHNKKNTLLSSHASGARSQPFIIRFFQAIIAFKRMVAMRRKWEVKRKERYTHQKSTLMGEIQNSQQAVKCASFGRDVVEMDEHEMRRFRGDEIRRIQKEREKKLEIIEHSKKRRGGVKAYDPSLDVGGSKPMTDPFAFSVGDKIKALKSKVGDELARQMESQKRALNRATMIRDSTAKDVGNIIQKNVHISKHDKKTGKRKHEVIK